MAAPLALMQAPRYTTADAARYLMIPIATLRSWVAGRTYPATSGVVRTDPVIIRPDGEGGGQLSYANLIEAHVLRSLRTVHEVSMRDVRAAIDFAEHEMGIEHLLLHQDLRTGAGQIFLDQYSKLIQLSKDGQLAMKATFETHLSRLDDYQGGFPFRLYPFTRREATRQSPKLIVIDPRIAFGQPTTVNRAIRTSVIASRLSAGETVHDIAKDYDLRPAEVEEAAQYEKAA